MTEVASSELEVELKAIRDMISQLTTTIVPLKLEKDEAEKEIHQHHSAINKLQAKQRDIDNKIFDANRAIREVEKKLQRQEAAFNQAKQNEEARLELERLTKQLDAQIERFKWKDLAFKHQIDGAKRISLAKRAILADKRGLGKTLTAIASADLMGAKKILAVVPGDVMNNFMREIQHWAPDRQPLILGGMTKAQRRFTLPLVQTLGEVFCIINYEAWRRDSTLIEELIKCQFDTVICDEAHLMKNTSGHAFRGVKDIVLAENQCPSCGEFPTRPNHCDVCNTYSKKFGDFWSVKNVIPMTGTPILNKPQDLYPLLHLVDPINFRSERVYLDIYCDMGWDGKWKFANGGEQRLTSRLAGKYVMRDRYTAGVEWPKQEVQFYNLELTQEEYPKQWEANKILSEKAAFMMEDLMSEDGGKVALPILYTIALITRKRQMMTWPADIKYKHPVTGELLYECDVTESIKIDRCIEAFPDKRGDYSGLISDLVSEGERVVLFSQFKQPLKEIERRLNRAGISCVRYDGDTPKSIANQVDVDFDRRHVDANNGKYKWDVVLANYRKGGVGLNFTHATQMIILDEEWNPGKVDQAYGRIDRMGQTEETLVHVLRVESSIDTWMQKLIEQKAEMIEGFESSADLSQDLLAALKTGQI